MLRVKPITFILSGILIVLFFWPIKNSLAQSSNSAVSSPDQADAIAVRVIPNPNHYGIRRWYESQGFQGAPQSLMVDGYEAIRDGRTVYVNAANVDSAALTIYTNIYLISYNQDFGPKTADILGQIVSHWKFNNNLSETVTPRCSISSLSCETNADCSSDQTCATSGPASSSCILKNVKNCLIDADCPTNFFCDSLKAKVARDTNRLGRVEELREGLSRYKRANQHYPDLLAGTYLNGHSISVWPSWSQVLISALSLPSAFLDPINRLGSCPGYDLKTCWNSLTKKFVNDPVNTSLTLPAGSYALAYSTDSNGSIYNLCSTIETREPALNYHFSPNDFSALPCLVGGSANNTAPRLVDKSLTGEAGHEFNGFIRVVDAENNQLSWSIDGPFPGWSGRPVLQDTSNPNQKKIYATVAGPAGPYPMTLTVSDGQGGTLNTSTPISIFSSNIAIEADDAEYVLDPVDPFAYSFSFASNNLGVPANAYNLTKLAGPNSFNLFALTRSFAPSGANRYTVSYRGVISTSSQFFNDENYKYQIRVTDRDGNASNKDFNLKIKVDNPALNFSCPVATRRNEAYNCSLGPATQGHHAITYSSLNALPAGMNLSGTNLTGAAAGTTMGFAINIKAKNEYGASSTRAFSLRVNNYCADGVKQEPNMEAQGGFNNDGYEDCDGLGGVTADVSLSKIDLQYGCRTGVGSTTPNPILTNNYCVYQPPLAGGGYCLDGYCQSGSGETVTNCCQDCQDPAVGCPP